MLSRSIITFVAASALSLAAASAHADMLAQWTFETSVPTTAGPHTAEGGVNAASSFASSFHALTGVVYSNPVGNGSLESFSSNFWSVGDYYAFSTSSLGYMNIAISWDQTRSSTGPATWDLYWSTDNSNFTLLLDDYSVPAISWSSAAPDATGTTSFGPVAGPTDLDNQGTIYFRLVADSAASGTAGSSRVDNIVITGDLIPAPGALALLGLAGLVSGRRRR